MAPAKNNTKSVEVNPWGWCSQVTPEKVEESNILSAYRVNGFQPCQEGRRNCKRNPYCVWGLGEKKWSEDSEGDTEEEGTAFRCEGEYAGLQNLGATCYVNSLLQLWYHNPIFRPAILKWTPSSNTLQYGEYKPSCPLAQLQAIFARLKVSKRSKIDPSDFVSSLLLNTGEQQDAQEFAKLFMDFIVKLLSDYGDDHIRKLIAQSFNGQSQYETECLSCKNKTRRPEVYTELNLSVKKNLNESLDELLADEIIDEYMCSNCHRKSTAKRRFQLTSLPPILNLQLLRFVYDREQGRRKKVTQSISFPEVLEMQHRISKSNSQSANSSTHKYHLTAVLIHNGPSASSGHYVAQIKDLKNGEWLKFNDEFVDPVNKAKNQKSKEEEADDPDQKTKTKKSKNSPSLASSGAYMLVYTLEDNVKNPEPDPELHQYLIDLVRQEDASFEMEVNKNKNEKDFELAVKVQRRKEVEWLYSVGKKPVTVNGKHDSDAEGPKAKIARLDKHASSSESKEASSKGTAAEAEGPEGPCDSTKNGNSKKSNGVTSEGFLLPSRQSTYSLNEIDFVSVDWIAQWLDPGNPVPPIENGMLTCQHKKLSPPLPNATPCLYRIIPSPLAKVWYEHYQGGPRLRENDLCEICVQTQCRKLRWLSELDEDAKQVQEYSKKCDSECSNYQKNGESIPAEVLADKCWVNKDSFRNWKKMAKRIIEDASGGSSDGRAQNRDSEMQISSEEGTDVNTSFNADLFCEHGNLSPDTSSRKLIPVEVWTIIVKYFKDAVMLCGTELPCDECRNQEQANSVAVQQNKDIASKQRAGLQDLFLHRNRPDVEHECVLYIVSSAFVADWRRFIKDPSRNEIVQKIRNHTLICAHKKFKYPIMFISEFLKFGENKDEMVCLVTPAEWTFIQQNFECDHEIKVNVGKKERDKTDNLDYDPDICNECAELWLEQEYRKQFEYQDVPIYVIRREKGEANETDEDDVSKEQPVVTGKREVKPFNRDAWMAGLANTNDSVRRSQRPRNAKSEKTYKVSSGTTVKELKSKICQDFKALLSDQHIFYEDTELSVLARSLGSYNVPARAHLYLEIDTAENGSIEEPMSTVETGFQGTLLHGGGGAFGDRSPLQNS